jgi:hypothetical protein
MVVKDDGSSGEVPTIGQGSRPRRAAAVAAQKRLARSSSSSHRDSDVESENEDEQEEASEQSLATASTEDELELEIKKEVQVKEEQEMDEEEEEENSDDEKTTRSIRRVPNVPFVNDDDDGVTTSSVSPIKKRKRQGSSQSTKSKYQRIRGTLSKRTCPTCQRVFTSPHGLKYHVGTCVPKNTNEHVCVCVWRRPSSHSSLSFISVRQESLHGRCLGIDRQVCLSHVGAWTTVLHKVRSSLGRGR